MNGTDQHEPLTARRIIDLRMEQRHRRFDAPPPRTQPEDPKEAAVFEQHRRTAQGNLRGLFAHAGWEDVLGYFRVRGDQLRFTLFAPGSTEDDRLNAIEELIHYRHAFRALYKMASLPIPTSLARSLDME